MACSSTSSPLPMRVMLLLIAGSNTNHRARVHKEEQLMTPSFRFPLLAGGTEWVRSAVPLAKRGEPAGGGQLMHFEHAIGIRRALPSPSDCAPAPPPSGRPPAVPIRLDPQPNLHRFSVQYSGQPTKRIHPSGLQGCNIRRTSSASQVGGCSLRTLGIIRGVLLWGGCPCLDFGLEFPYACRALSGRDSALLEFHLKCPAVHA